MHVLMDARALQKHVDGIGRYSLGVMRALRELKPDWELVVIVNPEADDHLECLPVKPLASSVERFRHGENRELNPLIDSSGADCYLNFSMAGPTPYIPTLISLHDLMVLNVPGYFGSSFFRNLLGKLMFRRRIKSSVAHASAISVLSEATLSDLLKTYPGAEKKAFVAGAGQDLFSDELCVNSERKNYILYVGNAKAYKNVTRLIVAYSRLKAINPRFPEMKMVVRKDRAYKNFMRDLDDCSARDSISILSGITDEGLKQLYRECMGLVIPSLKEGFGLPALEAMAAGSPVVASSGTALEELVGDAGIYVDPESVESIMHGMAMLTSQKELRSSLSEKALKRAGNYSWEKTAETIAERIEAITS